MILTPEDIELHKRLIRSYEVQVDQASRIARYAELRLHRYEKAIENEKEYLRSEGVDI